MASPTTRVVTLEIPTSLVDEIDQMADRLKTSPDEIMHQALSAWIEREEERAQLTREALEDVDAGHVIHHQAVQSWADGLNTDNPQPIPR